MASPLPYPIHSIAEAATQIYQGEDPWFALGCFLHDWWCDARDHRQDLIAEPPAPVATPEGRRWAAFCAAVVEELCSKTLPLPCMDQAARLRSRTPLVLFLTAIAT